MARWRELSAVVLLYIFLVAGLFYFPRVLPERSLELKLITEQARVEVSNSSSILHVRVAVENTHWEPATWRATFIHVLEARILGRATVTTPAWLNSTESGAIKIDYSQTAENETTLQLDRLYVADQNTSRVIVVGVKFSVHVLARVSDEDVLISSPVMETEAKDDVPPQIKWISPLNASYVTRGFSFRANYSDSGFGINLSDVSLKVDGAAVGSANGSYTLTPIHFEFTPYEQLAEGNHSATFTLSDYQGNKAKTFVSFTVDTTPPTVSISYPQPNSSVSGVVSVNGTAQDTTSGIRKVEIRIDGGVWKNAVGTLNWRYSWNATALSGEHSIEVRSVDKAGLQSGIVSMNVTVAPKAPS